jgi:hypothetical protein
MSKVIPFPARRVTQRDFIKQPYGEPDREHAMARIREAREYLASGQGDWFQRGHAEWLVGAWQKTLDEIDRARDNIIPLRRGAQ